MAPINRANNAIKALDFARNPSSTASCLSQNGQQIILGQDRKEEPAWHALVLRGMLIVTRRTGQQLPGKILGSQESNVQFAVVSLATTAWYPPWPLWTWNRSNTRSDFYKSASGQTEFLRNPSSNSLGTVTSEKYSILTAFVRYFCKATAQRRASSSAISSSSLLLHSARIWQARLRQQATRAFFPSSISHGTNSWHSDRETDTVKKRSKNVLTCCHTTLAGAYRSERTVLVGVSKMFSKKFFTPSSDQAGLKCVRVGRANLNSS